MDDPKFTPENAARELAEIMNLAQHEPGNTFLVGIARSLNGEICLGLMDQNMNVIEVSPSTQS